MSKANTPEDTLTGLDHPDADLVELLRKHAVVSETIGRSEVDGWYDAERHGELADIEIAIHQRVSDLRE